ncbi:hypothetical protein ABTL56_19750, partial [Acinetobacter baumannii]
AKGKQAFTRLERASHDEVGKMIAALPAGGEERLVAAMTTIERLLGDEAPRPEVTVRTHKPGDMGWVVQQHGMLYAREYSWDISF